MSNVHNTISLSKRLVRDMLLSIEFSSKNSDGTEANRLVGEMKDNLSAFKRRLAEIESGKSGAPAEFGKEDYIKVLKSKITLFEEGLRQAQRYI